MTGHSYEAIEQYGHGGIAELPEPYEGAGYVLGHTKHYDKTYALDLRHLGEFLRATQPEVYDKLNFGSDTITRQKFLARLRDEITKRGIVDVLRKGVKHDSLDVFLMYGTPSAGNQKSQLLFQANIFSITRQLQYSRTNDKLALDLCLFINGVPVCTFELKNRLTNQNVEHAVRQYQRDRDHRDLLFAFPRCLVHFAVDEQVVRFCTKLAGKDSWFLPFNKGDNNGAGNPVNPMGIKTDYLWHEVLTRDGLIDIIENYAQLVTKKDDKTGRKKHELIFPRYHQRVAVRALLADARENGPGKSYLVQHSAGSGKSNSIAWLAHQLVGLEQGTKAMFSSVIVVTDRRLLDKQLKDTVKQFAQGGHLVGHAERAGHLKELIQQGKRIIITTLQKFPFVLDDIGGAHKHNTFAIRIDEAHSSQSGKAAAKLQLALSGTEAEMDYEDEINRILDSRKPLPNASYFAFTATPKNKTLERFGVPIPQGDGTKKFRAFHSYTMKQAIEEGFIMDVLQNYISYASYYKIAMKVEGNPSFDRREAMKKLRTYVETHPHAIRRKTEIMVDHFLTHVIGKHKVGGQGRAMVVTGSIRRALEYFEAFRDYLKEINSPYKAIVAFSGEPLYKGVKVTEGTMNGFPSNKIEEMIKEDPYRILICANKFQTGYDEPLLHTMYVDKKLSHIQAVQTLSRLNRAHPQKNDTCVVDFANDAEDIQKAFEPYYLTTILANETDPNKLHDLKSELDQAEVYKVEDIERVVQLYLEGADRATLEPILEACAEHYRLDLDEDGQVAFKGNAKAFMRTYNFLASVLEFKNVAWEKLNIFLNLLVPKLPAPKESDGAKELLRYVDLDSYRSEARAAVEVALSDEGTEIQPVPIGGGGFAPVPEPVSLDELIQEFNGLFGNVDFNEHDRVMRDMLVEIPAMLAKNQAYQNAMKNSGPESAKLEMTSTLEKVVNGKTDDDLEFYKLFHENPHFKKWFIEKCFTLTYHPSNTPNSFDSHAEG